MPPHHRCFVDHSSSSSSSGLLLDATADVRPLALEATIGEGREVREAPTSVEKGKGREESVEGEVIGSDNEDTAGVHGIENGAERTSGVVGELEDERDTIEAEQLVLQSPITSGGLSQDVLNLGGGASSVDPGAPPWSATPPLGPSDFSDHGPSPLREELLSSSRNEPTIDQDNSSSKSFAETETSMPVPLSDYTPLALLNTNNETSAHYRPRLSRRSSAPNEVPRMLTHSQSPDGTSARHLDPDSHWLSEDEAEAQSSSSSRRRIGISRRLSHDSVQHTGKGNGGGHGGKSSNAISETPDLATFESTTHAQHSIHHRPAAITLPSTSTTEHLYPTDPWPSSSASALEQLIPALVADLTCQGCNGLMRDPTTLACGHTACMTCVNPSLLSQPLYPSNNVAPSSHLPHSSESLFARNPASPPRTSTRTTDTTDNSTSTPSYTISSLLRRGSSSSSTSTERISRNAMPTPRRTPSSHSTSSLRNKTSCPHPVCKAKERNGTVFAVPPSLSSGSGNGRGGTGVELRVDFVLQKVVGLLRREVGDGTIQQLLDTMVVDHNEGRPGSISSMDSGGSGGVGQPGVGEDEAKRSRRRTSWEASKRVRRSPPDGISVDGVSDSAPSPPIIHTINSNFISELQLELECQVCVQLLYDPITSPCGHTFCQKCLARSLDHSDKCPLCRADFPSFTYFQNLPVNETAHQVILSAWPSYAAERKAAFDAEEMSSTLNTPIFICTLSWPSLPTYIHIFEPRYRLMIRRVLNGDRKFGMVLPSREGSGPHKFGTMLYVKSCSMIEDGRSIIETVGTYRFRILERGTLDGYTVARIERIGDVSPEQELELEQNALARNPPPPPVGSQVDSATQSVERTTRELMDICLHFVQTLHSGSAPWVLQRLNNTIGPMPTDPSDFSFWMAEVMPVDDYVKAALLEITSIRERLRLIVFWIEQFRSSWWFSRGCSVM